MSSRSVDRSSTLGTASVRAVERKLPKLTEEQILEFKEAFKLFDKDNGGSIDVDELKDALESLGQVVTEESVQELVDEVDEDGSGEIEFDEFLVLMSRQILNSDVVSFKRTLSLLCRAVFLSRNWKWIFFLVFFSLPCPITQVYDCEKAFAIWDTDHDGRITVEQVRSVFQRLPERPTNDEIEALIDIADADRDGMIDFEDLMNMLDSYKPPHQRSNGK
jgi:Ca2+-binding EF-hand superfamily protein